MKVLHIPFIYYPDPCGGTEIYVAALCRLLNEAGHENIIAAPGKEMATYEHESLRVHRFATHPELTQEMMYGTGDPVAAQNFARVLDEVRPDLVHFHAFSPGVSVLCLHETQQRGIKTLATYHTPTVSCQRGTLMQWGTSPCDGQMIASRCSACFLNSHGMTRPLAKLAAYGSQLSWPFALLPGLSNAMRAVLSATPLMARRIEATREWWGGMSRVIALCEWTKKLLLLNGVPDSQIRKVRHGLPTQVESRTSLRNFSPPLRLAFLGRLDANKGIDLLIQALRLAPELPVTLDLFTIAPAGEDALGQKLMAQAKEDSRINFRPPVPAAEVVSTLCSYDALAVPSRGLETGPLVVLEAFAAGIPVVGSDLGGISEWVKHEGNGLLVPTTTAAAWHAALSRLALEPGLLTRLQAGVCAPRTMREVAADMNVIYQEILTP